MKIFKKEHEVTELAVQFLEASERCVEKASAAMVRYLEGEVDPEEAAALVAEVGAEEAEADRIVREMRDLLFSGAYLPLIRADIYALVDSLDHLPNAAESCARFFYTERPEVPEELRERFIEVTGASFAIFSQLKKSAKGYFKPKDKVDSIRKAAEAISMAETEVDTLELALTRDIFNSSLELAHKAHLRNALRHCVRLSDLAEDTSDQLVLMAMKAIA